MGFFVILTPALGPDSLKHSDLYWNFPMHAQMGREGSDAVSCLGLALIEVRDVALIATAASGGRHSIDRQQASQPCYVLGQPTKSRLRDPYDLVGNAKHKANHRTGSEDQRPSAR